MINLLLAKAFIPTLITIYVISYVVNELNILISPVANGDLITFAVSDDLS